MSPTDGLVQSGIFADQSAGHVADEGHVVAAGALNAEIAPETVVGILEKTAGDGVAPHSNIAFAANAGKVTVGEPAGGLSKDPSVQYAETEYRGYDMFGVDPGAAKPS